MTNQILTTKLFLPAPRPDLVSRPRLLAQLDDGLRRKLTLVCAPAGFGKTTVLGEWAAQADVACCWLTLDQADNDVGRFLAYLLAALHTVGLAVDEQRLALLQSRQLKMAESFLIPLINQVAAAEARVVLVLDDYHLIENQEIHGLLAYLLERLPPNLHLVLSTRSDPPLPLARLRARNQLSEMRAQQLRFTLEEAKAFLVRSVTRQLPGRSMQALLERTDGWISGLQMAALSLQFSENPVQFVEAFAGSNQYIFDYLTDEVLSHQSPLLTTFLVRTSILEKLCAPLCEAVTAIQGSQQMLETLLESNTFLVPLDNTRTWFRYHQLFRDVLSQRLQETEPEQIQLFHRRAWRWLAQAGFAVEAIDHAIAAREYEAAARAIEAQAERTLLHGQITTFLNWLEQLPPAVVQEWPLLSLYQAEALLLSGMPFQDVATRMQGATEHIGLQALARSYAGDIEGSTRLTRQALALLPQDSTFIRAAIVSANAALLLLSGDVSRALHGFADAVTLATAGDNLLLEVVGCVRQGQLLATAGRFADARLFGRHALRRATGEQGHLRPLASFPLCFQAYLSYLTADDATALEAIRQAVALVDQYGGFWAVDCYIIYALILEALGQSDEALAAIQRARTLSRQTSANPFDDVYLAAYEAQLWIAQGRLAQAAQWARERELIPAERQEVDRQTFFHIQELEELTLARLHIAQEQPQAALAILEALAPAMAQLGRQGRLLENYALQAVAFQLQEQQGRAGERLATALSLLEPGGAIRPFVEYRPTIDPLLHKLARREAFATKAGRLLAFPLRQEGAHTPTTEPEQVEMVETLTEREAEVLRWLTSELTVPEMAERSQIAVSTVRTHIRNIYGKLGVHSRYEAVVKAQTLELI